MPTPKVRCYDRAVRSQSTTPELLEAAIAEYRAATPTSAALHRRASVGLPAGVTSNVKFFPPHPVFLTRAGGSRVIDVDGREYVDYCLAFGPLVTGHGHPRVLDAVRAEIERAGTVILGAPSDLELRLADRLRAVLPSAEMVRFTNSGTEATLHALRIARGATGRASVVKFEGHYHGAHDHVLWNLDRPLPAAASDGIPPATAGQTIVVPFGDAGALKAALESRDDIAAIILEPIARGVIEPTRAFLEDVRALATAHGAILIFDEVVVWPRVGLGGAQALYGIRPDLTTLGKALGGGLPLGAIVGRRDLLSLVAPRAARTPDDGGPYVFHGGTYNGTPAALAAGLATLNILEEPGTIDTVDLIAAQLRHGLVDVASRLGVAMQVIGRGSIVDFYFTDAPIRSSREIWASNLAERRALDYRLLARGIYNVPLHRYHLSIAHTAADVDRTLTLFEGSLTA